MGGQGSGEWSRSGAKNTVESRLSVDVGEWQRKDLLYPGRSFSVFWRRVGTEGYSINVQVEFGQVRLKYRVGQSGQEGEDIDEAVRLTSTPCNYGGQRRWFVCPTRSCGRRVAVLHLGSKYFLCRCCCGLAYASQREDRKYRALHRIQKIRMRLGGSGSVDDLFPEKPNRMRRTTYERLKEKDEEAQSQLWEAESEWYSKRERYHPLHIRAGEHEE
jgi:hypothetical protein